MSPDDFSDYIFPAGFSLMPHDYDTPKARAMILAICLQETKFTARVQVLDYSKPWWESRPGPANGFAQFEVGTVALVMKHPAVRTAILDALAVLGYPMDAAVIHDAMRHNDLLTTVFARCLLRTVPDPLPDSGDSKTGWGQYMWAWRPGKPHEETWEANWRRAWETVLRR